MTGDLDPSATDATGLFAGVVSGWTPDTDQSSYTHPSDITIENGKIQTNSLIVGRERIELGSISINDWTTGDPIEDGEALN